MLVCLSPDRWDSGYFIMNVVDDWLYACFTSCWLASVQESPRSVIGDHWHKVHLVLAFYLMPNSIEVFPG